MTHSLADAVELAVSRASPLEAEDLLVAEATGRVLAEPVVSRLHLPPWDNAGMDGYAVRSEDVRAASGKDPVRLRVIETVQAGAFPSQTVAGGMATRIMTGAPVPDGADSVVRVEDTDGGTGEVEIRDSRDVLRNVRPRGEDIRAGDEVLPAGAAIAPWVVGAIAAAGVARVRAHRQPRVAVLGGGDELVTLDGLDEALAGRRIIASNGYALEAMARDAGADVISLGVVPDDERALSLAIESARDCDLLLTTGGVSVGAFDFVRAVFNRLGGTLHFWRVRMRPGAQLAFGSLEHMLWLGLPGNPASAVVTFEVFARPMIRRMLGYAEPFRQLVDVRLTEPVTTTGAATFFLRAAVVAGDDGGLHATLSGRQGSHVQSAIARANALLVVPEGTKELPAGTSGRAMPLIAPAHWTAQSPWPA